MLISKRLATKMLSLVLLLVLSFSLYAPLTTYAKSDRIAGPTGRKFNSLTIQANSGLPVRPTDAADYDDFTAGMVLSKDGLTAVTSGSKTRSLYVFTRTSTTIPFTNTNSIKLATSDTPAPYDYFPVGNDNGLALSDDGLTIVAGAPQQNVGQNVNQGVVYIFKRTPNTAFSSANRISLTSFDGAVGDNFGQAVAVSGNGKTIIVAAPYKNVGGNNRGAVYIYNFASNGINADYLQNRIRLVATPAAGNTIDKFGKTLALSSDGLTALIGGMERATNGAFTGIVYAYSRTLKQTFTNQQVTRLTRTDAPDTGSFGEALTLSSDGLTALIGAPWETINGNYLQGSAYLFNRPNKSAPFDNNSQSTISDPANEPYTEFANAVALSSDGLTALIGAHNGHPAPKEMAAPTGTGEAYLYTRVNGGNTFANPTQLLPYISRPANQGDNFGATVSLSGDGKSVAVGMRTRYTGQHNYHGEMYNFSITR